MGDIFCTATGDKNVIRREHFELMKDGAILSNTGHFNVEIEIPALEQLAASVTVVRPMVQQYEMADGRRLFLLAEGRLVNLAAAEGHPASVMDMSFANQALSAEFVVKNHAQLERKVYVVPEDRPGRILSYRSGYGAVPLALRARYPEARVVAQDRDLLALAFARKNAGTTGLSGEGLRLVGCLFPSEAMGPGEADLIVGESSAPAGPAVFAR